QHLRCDLNAAVARTNGSHSTKVATCTVPAEGQRPVGPAELVEIRGRPLCSGKRVIHALWEWVLGRQSIVDVEDDDARTIGKAYSVHLMAIDIANHVAAAMIIDERTNW